jgi:hypothetical protein
MEGYVKKVIIGKYHGKSNRNSMVNPKTSDIQKLKHIQHDNSVAKK